MVEEEGGAVVDGVELAVPDEEVGIARGAVDVLDEGVEPDEERGFVGRGGVASGRIRFRDTASTFDWRIRASGLTGGRAYRVQLTVDGHAFDVASARADYDGVLSAAGRLFTFKDHVCMGATSDAPVPIDGAHRIGIVIKDDGAARSGGGDGGGVTGARSGTAPCSGNGDGDFAARLSELRELQFTGT